MRTFKHQILIAHAKGEDELAEQLAEPIKKVGYEVAHRGTVMVGESFTEEASRVLSDGGPVVLCGTSRAIGAKWARQLVHAARNKSRIFCVQMEEEADVDFLTFDEKIALYWQDPTQAIQDLIAALSKHYPLEAPENFIPMGTTAEQRYRELALESCDIIDLVNLPESDRHIATRKLELRRLYVAVRVQVEITLETEVEEAALEALEKRRKSKQLVLARWISSAAESDSPSSTPVSIGERLAKSRRLIVLGDPGAGKTTMLRWIATAYLLRLKGDPEWKDLPDVATLPDEDWLPIIIRCRDLNEFCLNGALDDFLNFTLRKAEMSEAECVALRQLLPQKLQKGEAILLVDGLDEITDPSERTRFCRQIEQICIAYPQAPIIATSRIVGYREMGYRLGRGFEHVTVADFSKEEKDDFARRWCAVTELPERQAKATEELIQDIHSSDRIERLTGNPMLLTTMALVKRKVGKLPNRRADLYWEAVQVLLNWRREVDAPIDYREAIPQLEYIAYAMCDRGVQQLREDEILDLLHQMRQEYHQIHQLKDRTPEEFLRLLERRTGILIEAGHVRHAGQPVPVFEFRHLTLQEYLAGKALVDGRFPNRDRDRSLADFVGLLAGRVNEISALDHDVAIRRELAVTENWREAIRLCVSMCKDDEVDELLRAILTSLEGEDNSATAHPRAVMAALCLADEPNVSVKVAEKILQNFINQIEEIEENDFWFVNESNLHEVARELIKSIWIELFRKLLLNEYVQRYSPDRDKYGNFYGVVFTSPFPSNEGRSHFLLEEYLLQMKSFSETEVISAIFIVKHTIFRSVLGSSLHRSKFSETFSTEAVKNSLSDIVLENSSAPLAAAAADLLSFLKSPFIRSNWQFEELHQLKFIELIENPATDTGVVISLANILGDKKVIQATEVLITKLDDPNERVRQSAASALGEIQNSRAVEPLIIKLDDPSERVRQSAASALGEIQNSRAVKPLIIKLDDPSESVRQSAASALGRIQDSRAVEPLIIKLDDPNESVRQSVASALGEIQNSRAVKPLIIKLDDPSERVRQSVASALGRIQDSRAVEPLIIKLDDPSESVRQFAASALGRIQDSRAVEPLIIKLDDPSESVRQFAASALGRIQDSRAVEPLIIKLDDPNESLRWAVADALVMLKNEQTIKKQFELLTANERNTRIVALQVLSRLCEDEIDRKLLSQDLDAFAPFLDPQEEIDETQIYNVAKTLKISVEEVTTRYEALAQRFSLKLKFDIKHNGIS